MKLTILNFLFFIIMFSSCNNGVADKDGDYFYQDNGGIRLKRIPLIKPYEAKKISESEWRIELKTTQLLELSIHDVKAINVIDNVILVYSKGSVSLKGRDYHQAWFIIVPSKGIEKGFSSRTEYFSHLEKSGILSSKIYNIDALYDIFNRDGKINWKIIPSNDILNVN